MVCVGGLARTLRLVGAGSTGNVCNTCLFCSLFADPIFHKLFGTKYPEYKLSFTKKLSEKGDPKGVCLVSI